MNVDAQNGQLELNGVLGIDNAHELRTALLAMLESPCPAITVHMGSVTEVDLVAIQIFHSGVLSTRRRSKQISFHSIPPQVQAKFNLIGLPLPCG